MARKFKITKSDKRGEKVLVVPQQVSIYSDSIQDGQTFYKHKFLLNTIISDIGIDCTGVSPDAYMMFEEKFENQLNTIKIDLPIEGNVRVVNVKKNTIVTVKVYGNIETILMSFLLYPDTGRTVRVIEE